MPGDGRTLWVLGDNPRASADSRQIGAIPMDRIVGRVALIYWPSVRAGLPGPGIDQVEAAGPVALEVERAEAKTGFPDRRDDPGAQDRIAEPGQVVVLEFDSRHVTVMTHPQLSEPEIPQGLFGGLHGPQAFFGHFGPAGNPRGQAGGGGLGVDRKPKILGKLPHPLLVHPCFEQWRPDPPGGRRLHPGAVVADVVLDRPVRDLG